MQGEKEMNIAICDDNINYSKQTEKYVRETVGDLPDLDIDIYISGNKLLDATKEKTYDIVFLDIEMPGIKGLDVAKSVRENDSNVIIAFLTNYSEFATRGYEVSAFRYILKEEPESIIIRQVNSIINEYYRKQKSLVIYIKYDRVTININVITYLEVIKRVIIIHTVSGKTYEFYGTLNDLINKLAGFGFIRPHQSYLVNMSYIESVALGKITLKTGEFVPVSRSLKSTTERAYVNYVTSL